MEAKNLIIDLSDVPMAVRAEFVRGHHARAALAEVRQKQVAIANSKFESRMMDGLGTLDMRVDSEVYWNMRRVFGPDCWKDKNFRKSFKAKNPGAAVKAHVHTGRILRP